MEEFIICKFNSVRGRQSRKEVTRGIETVQVKSCGGKS